MSFKPWISKDMQTASIGVYSLPRKGGGSRGALSTMTLTHALQCQLIPLMESDTIAHMRQTALLPSAKQRAIVLPT